MELFRKLYMADDGNAGGTPPVIPPKTYNQDELNGIVGDRLAKERTKIYKTLGIEDESGIKDISTRLKKLADENATLLKENDEFKKSHAKAEKSQKLIDAGIDKDFIDIAIEKWDGKSDLETFKKDNPKLTSDFFKNFRGTGGTLNPAANGREYDQSKLSTEEYFELKKKGKI